MIKRITKKSLSIILCVTVLLSCMVFAMPSASAATTNYTYRVYFQTPDQYEMEHDQTDVAVYYKAENGTSTDTTTSTSFTMAKDTLNDDYAEWYYPSENGATIPGFPWKVGLSAIKSNNFAWNAHIHVELQIKSGSTWVRIAGNTGNEYQNISRKSNMTDITVDTADYPKTTFPTSVTTTPANKVTLNGTSTKTVTVNATDLYDQYGVKWGCDITYSNPVYNADAFSISGKTLSITKDAHIGEEGMNQQSITIKTKWAGQEIINTKIIVEDETYTATYKWYESNEANPASPSVQTESVTGIYYGDFPEEEQVPEPVDHYYTDTQHFTNGQFPSIPTNNTYTMTYTSAPHSMLTKVEEEATCQGPGTTKHYCNCGYFYIEEGTPAQVDHDYVATVVDPTCTEQGYTLHTCRFCGINYKDNYTDALEHNYRRTDFVEATCTVDGYKTYKCRRCGDEYTEIIKAQGHDYASMTVEPTCTQGGYTMYACNNCMDSYTGDFTDPLGHDHQLYQDIPATCTTAGKKIYKCTRCTDSYSEDFEALGHDFETLPSRITTQPTCTEDGVRTYYCSRCDAVQTEPITATGHNYEKITIAPDCEHQGYDLYKCKNCQDEYSDPDSFTDALGHLWDEGEITTRATCTENGVKTFKCSRCQQTKEEEITATGHSYKATSVVEPTCTEKGYTVFTCENCSDTYNGNLTDELGHNFSTNEITTQPTCTEQGVRTYYCSRCTQTRYEPVEALGHNYIPTVVPPTCTEQGYTEYKCSRCTDTYTDNYVDSLGGHLFTDYFYNEDATCTENGTETAICDRCDATDTRTVENSALGHSFVNYVSNEDATCTENGTETAKCERCEVTDTRTVENSALGHSFVNYVSNEDATCTENGTETAKCERCDVTDTRTVENSALGHSFVNYVSNEDATCTENGTETAKCERCEVTDTRTVENSALGHNYGEWEVTTEPTCTQDGQKSRTCSRCKDVETDTIKATGHSYIETIQNATCTEDGYKETTCSKCDYYLKEPTGETALGHNFGQWQTKTPASCGVEGENIRYCSRCDAFETEPVPALEHHWTQVIDEPANETNGYVYYKCDNCSKYCNAVLDIDNTAKVGNEIFEDVELVKADTLEISAPTFNKYYSDVQQYDYSTRGAALKYSDPTYIDDYTTQDTRFTASLFIPSNIDVSFSGSGDNKITDFGFVFAQTQYIESEDDLELGKNAYSLSVAERNANAGDISNWSGVTVHDDTFGGSTLTFNLLIKIKAKNWTKDYCARAYVTYSQNGFSYTVYDNAFASRSVADIARAVVASDTETPEAKDYCQTKILDNLDNMN